MNEHPTDVLVEVGAVLRLLYEVMCEEGRRPEAGWTLSGPALHGLACITRYCLDRVQTARQSISAL